MELNMELNKVVGNELAQILYKNIPEEKLQRYADDAWDSLSKRDYNGKSDLSFEIKRLVLNGIQEKVKSIMQTEEYIKEQQKVAEEVVKEIEVETRRKLVENISDRLCGNTIDSYGNMRYVIEDIFRQMMNR